MITQYNEATHKHEWVLVKWWDKAFYIYGFVNFWLYAIAFAIGFLVGIILTIAE